MRAWASPPLQFLMLTFAGWVNDHQQDAIGYLREENRVLREQLGGRRIHLTDVQRRRLAQRAKRVGRRGLFEVATLVTPDTLLRWYATLIARKYDGSRRRGPGRPKTAVEVEVLITRVAREDPRWGYTRIRGALYNLGHEITACTARKCFVAGRLRSRNTVKRVLLESGFDPAAYRRRGMSWRTFLEAHWGRRHALRVFPRRTSSPLRSSHGTGSFATSCSS